MIIMHAKRLGMFVSFSLQIISIYGDEGKKGENISTNDIHISFILHWSSYLFIWECLFYSQVLG